MTTYAKPTKVPCNDCPFRRRSMPGWLGAGSPESFIHCINTDDPLPCHQTIDYEDPNWKEKWVEEQQGSMCAGALILMANMQKLPRDRGFPRLPQDKETVFATAQEFVCYHREARGQSWDDDDQSDESKWLRKVFRDATKAARQPLKEGSCKKSRRHG